MALVVRGMPCLERHPLGREAKRWHEEVRRRTGPGQRACAVCGEEILDPDDFFGTFLLSRDPRSPLHAFNFVCLHRSHADRWERLDQLRRVIDQAVSSGDLVGARLAFGATAEDRVRWVAT